MEGENTCQSRKLVLVGNPNVGKSVIFRLLTGRYVIVSNFPGTTVEVLRGRMQIGGVEYDVIDTPGVNSLVPQSEDERVTCEILLCERPDVIVQVADAKNLRRTLLITSQLMEFGIPMVLVLNMIDEAEERGVEIDSEGLSEFLAVPVVETVAIYSRGRRQLLNAIQNVSTPKNPLVAFYSNENVVRSLDGVSLSPCLLSIEWLAQDSLELGRTVAQVHGNAAVNRLKEWRDEYRATYHRNPAREIAEIRSRLLDDSVASFRNNRRSRFAEESSKLNRLWLGVLMGGVFFFLWNEAGALLHIETPYTLTVRALARTLVTNPGENLLQGFIFGTSDGGRLQYGLVFEAIHILFFIAPIICPFGVLLTRSRSFVYEIGILTRRPSTGIPILVGVLLLVYEFVGYTGAQTFVNLIERVLFGQHFIPFLQRLLPPGFLWELMVGEYGLISMGISYAIGIVLPVVGTFFIAFGLLEDSGYLPRLSILSDRLMRVMGLNGKAILPMVLGLGCCTMATVSTRILSSKKERLIATVLLALGIPCSAQLGVILGIAAGFSMKAILTVIAVVASQLLLVGYLSSLVLRGRPSEFIFEIPPIRVPQLRNVLLKTGHRIQWYFKEAVPLFLYGTLVLFVFDKLQIHGRSVLAWIQFTLEPLLTGILHLPTQIAGIFILGFLRRDYGAAGLYEMTREGILTGQQVVVSLIVITLFVPCLASFLMIIKEQGLKRALAITGFIIPFAISVGGLVGWVLRTFNIEFR